MHKILTPGQNSKYIYKKKKTIYYTMHWKKWLTFQKAAP
jgi:hypothetical protein